MLIERPIFPKLAESALAELKRESLTPEPSEIVWLYHAAEKVIRPTPSDVPMLGFPVEIGGARLWPLTVGAELWLRHYADAWFDRAPLDTLARAFAHAHARQPDLLAECTTAWRTRWRLYQWAGRLSATVSELDEALRIVSMGAYELEDVRNPALFREPDAPSPMDWGEAIALLCRYSGGTPDYWLWQADEARIADCLAKIGPIIDPAHAGKAARESRLMTFRMVVSEIKRRARERAEKAVSSG